MICYQNEFVDIVYHIKGILPYYEEAKCLIHVHMRKKQQTNSTAEIDPIHEWQLVSLVYHWNHLVQMNSIGCIEYVIKYSHSMDTAIKRQCCHTLVTLSHCLVWIFNLCGIWSIWTSSKQWLSCWWIINTWRNRKSLLWLMHSWCCWKRVNLIQELGSILKKTYQCLKRFCLIQQRQPKSVRKYNGC